MTLAPHIAFMAEMPLPAPEADDGAPEWIHLLPAPPDGLVRTADSRGPYHLTCSLQSIIDESFKRTDRLEIDINHASLTAAKRGERSDAYGWIIAMQAREDGIWGRVEWTPEGRRLVADKAYRLISPAIMHDAAKNIIGLANASLVNRPNFRGMTALNQEGAMTLIETLAEMIGLGADTTEDQVVAALKEKLGGKPASETALQSQFSEVGVAFGLAADAAAAEIVAAAKKAKASGGQQDELITALQAELTKVSGRLDELSDAGARTRAEAFVDAAIRSGRESVKPKRDLFISLHMENPARAEEIVGSMLIVKGGSIMPSTPPAKDGEISLQAEEIDVARLAGVPVADVAAMLKAERAAEENAR